MTVTKRMTALIALSVASATAGDAISAAPASKSVALCRLTETPLFVCAIGSKFATVCGAGGEAVYRYGRLGRIEFEASGLVKAYAGFSGGGETQISFARQGTQYVLYDGTYRTAFGAGGQHDAQDRSGLIVLRNGKEVLNRTCARNARISSTATRFMPQGAFIAH